ncbi:family 78 glycoside hydrolase catalytic domain [Niabella ginsengisoli]|uniref:alpha-L-rhamnosidase n=1 Tax=Niabella ginsengisoli TaxID=522298 RepID=A0ABS9SIV4_9BACT|nr:family 78 glycoside hydrolase catalytic domain [Niabella ginsengisoli]MCH5598255.1 glycoside hydrolase family 78 protein [Niabella ginsengisoli]
MKIFSSLLFVVYMLCSLPIYAMVGPAKSLVATSLRCEYLNDPKGIDAAKPRFSWSLASAHKTAFGLKQQAYQIIIASSPENLSKNLGDFWDSKWVPSNNTQHILYAGKKLLSDRSYYWKVRVKDQNGSTSEWSDPASFTTGFYSASEWQGKWIGDSQEFVNNNKDCNIWDPWFRKRFILKEKPGRAFIYIASVGYHELYINGQKISSNVLAPATSDHTKRASYVAYDITNYLRKGENIAGLWLGASWSIFAPYFLDEQRPKKPIVNAQAFFYKEKDPGNLVQPFYTLITDNSWKTYPSPNKLLGIWAFGKMGGELWDDRKANESWHQLSHDEKGWQQANQYHPNLVLSSQMVESNTLQQQILPQKIEKRKDGSYRIDFGTNFVGWTNVHLRGNPGDTINMSFSERENMDMTFDMRNAFIIGQTGEGTFRNRFNYSSGRWLTIRGLKQAPELKDIRGWMIRTNYGNATTFACSDSLLNWMYDRIRWTFENLSLGGYVVDCPQRERMGYGGDAHATSETGMYNYKLGAFYTKWMQDWRDVQGTEPMVGDMNNEEHARKAVTSGRLFNNGVLPHTAPTYWGGGGPAWGGIVVTLPWFMYEYYGDTKVLTDNYSLIKNWLSFLDTHVEHDVLQRFGGQWDFLGDWLWPNATAEGMNNDKPETIFFNNCYRIFNLRTAAKVATVLQRSTDAAKWKAQADASAKIIHQQFFNKETNTYSDGSMGNMAVALLAEIVPQQLRGKVMAALEDEILIKRKGHIHAGITGGAMLFKLLRQENRNDLIYSMVSKTDYPGWGYMKANDATTIWEMWEKDLPGHSLLHSSYLFPGAWFIDGLVGIKPAKPGFSQFIIQPPAPGTVAVSWARASFKAPSGVVQFAWKRNADHRLSLEIAIPPNTSTLLKLSAAEQITIPESNNVRQLEDDGAFKMYELQSGSYSF